MSNNSIQGAIISCYKLDYWLARIAIGSIRYYYPDFPIFLLADEASGEFSTADAEDFWNVQRLDIGRKKWGNPMSRLSLLNCHLSGKYLFMDSDICFLGRVIDILDPIDEQFIVSGSSAFDLYGPHTRQHAYEFDKVREFDPDFYYPGYIFNAGQFVFTPNIIPQERIDALVDMTGRPFPKVAGLSALDQGVLNYLLPKLAQEGLLTIKDQHFKLYAGRNNASFMNLDMKKIMDADEGYPLVAHWSGKKLGRVADFPRPDILGFFQDYYYSRFPNGKRKQLQDSIVTLFRYTTKESIHQFRMAKQGIKPFLRALGLLPAKS